MIVTLTVKRGLHLFCSMGCRKPQLTSKCSKPTLVFVTNLFVRADKTKTRNKMKTQIIILIGMLIIVFASCKKSNDTTTTVQVKTYSVRYLLTSISGDTSISGYDVSYTNES